jgi:hypothetical protein
MWLHTVPGTVGLDDESLPAPGGGWLLDLVGDARRPPDRGRAWHTVPPFAGWLGAFATVPVVIGVDAIDKWRRRSGRGGQSGGR